VSAPNGPTPTGRAIRPTVFIEGPSFDAEGNLYIVDIPFGRIFRIAPGRQWTLAVEYEGWPNGLKISPEGRILVADYRHGIMELDAKAARVALGAGLGAIRNLRGCNDLHIAKNGDIYFTDQGQTRPARSHAASTGLKTDGRLDCLIDTGVSPNGLVLDPMKTCCSSR